MAKSDFEILDAIKQVLVGQLGVVMDDAFNVVGFADFFVHAQKDGHPGLYRFQGTIGPNSAIYWTTANGWFVACRPEDETPERRALIDKANRVLAGLNPKPARRFFGLGRRP